MLKKSHVNVGQVANLRRLPIRANQGRHSPEQFPTLLTNYFGPGQETGARTKRNFMNFLFEVRII
jgi:hypothetical protein